MLRDKTGEVSALCTDFCAYYKPGKSEDLACQGVIAVQRILASGKALSLERKKHAAAPDPRIVEGLKARVCAACAFRERDCDFILTAGRAAPCGGMVLLMQELGGGGLGLDDLGPVCG